MKCTHKYCRQKARYNIHRVDHTTNVHTVESLCMKHLDIKTVFDSFTDEFLLLLTGDTDKQRTILYEIGEDEFTGDDE
jgi:hypothetical protein